ncbi:MAG TPA: T9SS type A sorting domain-containing protein [Flavobacterium sp.]|uniref:DUF7619 domain-containing protein n=1 Tax=Flavobacterium sp. TaxID=239 RepID=UPI002BDE2E31|nr:T9SS type A sorting domain-containing protein [Flavobacterium sp.]HSD14459.1 T9SS type A sorting domain-containing protein [Flavobacterium sp.]
MKKNYFIFALFILLISPITPVFAQTPVCGGTFTDPAGPSANYANNSDYTVTIYPNAPGEFVTVTFTTFATEANWDGLYVFNGNSTASPQISSGNPIGNIPGGMPGAYWGTTIPGPFTSSSIDGSLTFRFRSDSSNTSTGWIANVTCIPPATCIAPTTLSISNVTQTSSVLSWSSTDATQWEVLLLPGSSVPTANQTGIITSANPFVFTGLSCGTSYRAYVKKVCSPSDSSSWSGPVTFTTTGGCPPPVYSTCDGANSLCGAFGVPFPNTTGVAPQGTMGCLYTTPNPTWFTFSVNSPGLINLGIDQRTPGSPTQNLSVDHIIYGPYSSPLTPCNGQLTPDKIVSCGNSPSFTATQSGQYYLMVMNFSNQPGYITITELPTTTASLECTGFRLNAFLDANSNGLKDVGEQSFPHGQFTHEKNNDGNVHYTVSSTGMTTIIEGNPANTYDFAFQIDTPYSPYFTLASPSFNDVSVPTAGVTNINFPIVASNPYNDLDVNITPIGQPRPGFTYKNRILYKNNGNQTINGTITFAKDDVLSISNISQTGTTSTANGFTYDFINLLPFESRTIEVSMQVPTIPTIQIGLLLTNTAAATILSGSDAIISNNNYTLSQQIVGSYDPNDITESHGNEITHSTFSANDYLYYTIQFENTGTASAINVRVNNVLSPELDETSIKMVHSSHGYVMDRVGSTLNWEFENIMLPATSQNPNTSKGYIVYKIKPNPGYAIGDIIPNTASIYFDFNPAITTNTFNTEFVSQLSVSEFENDNFIFYPNPVKDIITVSVKNNQKEISNITIYDISGKIVLNKTFSALSVSETIDLSQVSKGMYFMEVTTQSNLKTIKKLIVE